MAIAATVVWEVRTTATAGNVNGGGYKPGASGTDFSQQNAAQYNLTGVTTAAADAILLSASAAADMVGNIAHITSGTNFTVGWYEILSVSVGVSITLDRTCTTAAGAAGVVNIGGAISLAAANDDAVFETMVAGNTMHIKSGTYTIGGAVSVATDGTTAASVEIIGYNATRNDNPATADRPVLAFGANTSTFNGDYYNFSYITFTVTNSGGVITGLGSVVRKCKSTNSSGTANRLAFSLNGGIVLDSEIISTLGTGVNINAVSNTTPKIVGCYIHDSTIGISFDSFDVGVAAFNIIETIVTTGINIGTGSDDHLIMNNTIYGAATPAGSSTGILLAATTGLYSLIMNNIITGFVTGISSAAVSTSNVYINNNLFNNTTNYTNVSAGAGSLTLDPAFVDAPNGNFAVGANMKAVALPGAFPGGLSTGYLDIGAVQRQEPAGGGSIEVSINSVNITKATGVIGY